MATSKSVTFKEFFNDSIAISKQEREKEQKYLEILEQFYVCIVKEVKTKQDEYTTVQNLHDIID